jgi:poly(3-hydroxybutyrate) depolymerase
MKRLLSTLTLLVLAPAALAAPPKPGHHARISVTEPTRLDWTFVLTTRSLPKIPAEWKLSDYDSSKQTYELFVPTRKDTKSPAPLLLYLAASNEPNGFKVFEKLAKARGLFFVAPRGAGNDCPPAKRVRIVLDVLDDVRRQFAIDPDQTYITGFSGGGRIACAVAFALPELFGGVMPICAAGDLRQESWLRQRVIDRVSVALLTGEKDFNRGEVERWRGPYLSEVGVRAKVWTVSGLGHSIPGEKTQAEALKWLDDGLAKRRELARIWPASRYSGGDRAALAKALLAEGRKRVEKRGTLYSGLMQVKGVSERWPDLDAGKEARKLLVEYEEKSEKPWEADDVAEQRRFLMAAARGLDRYSTGPLDERYQKLKPNMLREAIKLYRLIAEDAPKSEAGKEAKKRLGVLEKMLEE